jgi:hypothetical protein
LNKLLRFSTRNIFNVIGIIFIIALSLIPVYRMSSIALTVGENNLSNDYITFSKTIIPIVNNQFTLKDWSQTCYRGGCEPLTLYVIALIAKLSHWNVFTEIGFSIGISIFSVFLLYHILADRKYNLQRLWLLVIISGLLFSFTCISTYTFGQAAVYTTLGLFGLCIGLYGLKFYANTYKGLIFIIIGGWISAWSYGAGILSIFILFIGLLLWFRKKVFYLLWVISSIVIGFPYIYSMFLNQPNSAGNNQIISLFRFSWVIQLIGTYFSNGFGLLPFSTNEVLFSSNPLLFGYSGIIFLIIGLFFMIRFYGIRNIKNYYPEIGLILFGIGTAWITSVIRIAITPWYVMSMAPFWIGLVGIYYSMFIEKNNFRLKIPILIKIVSIIFFSVIVILYVHSNIQYEDKIFHIKSRAPVSVSCLRNYKTAPTFCEPYLFQWTPGNPAYMFDLGSILENNQLSVFAPHQEMSLQGDYLFNSVKIHSSHQGTNPYWVDNSGNYTQWSDYHHLNLALPVYSSIDWIIDVPKELVNGKFSTQIAMDPFQKGKGDIKHNTILKIKISTSDGHLVEIQSYLLSAQDVHANWIPVEFPITSYRGKKLIISITQESVGGVGQTIYLRYPKISIEIAKKQAEITYIYQPENIININKQPYIYNLLPISSRPDIGINQLSYNNLLNNISTNTLSNIKDKTGEIVFQKNGNDCISIDSNLYITVTSNVSPSLMAGYNFSLINISYIGNDGENYDDQEILPMLKDGKKHTYSYPLKIINNLSYLTRVKLIPNPNDPEIEFEISNMGFYSEKKYSGNCVQQPLIDIPPKEPAGEIIKDIEVSQTFIPSCDGLSAVQLYFGTYYKKNSYPVIVKISDMDKDVTNMIIDDVIPPQSINDNSWFTVDFPKIEKSKDKTYRIDITSPLSKPGNAVTIWQSDKDVYPFGTEFINNKPIEKDITFRYRCKP